MSTSPGTLFPVTFRMVLTTLPTSYGTLSCQLHGVATMVTNSHTSFLCGQKSGGPYSCQVPYSFFRFDETYTFQVAAQNNEGIGSF